MNVPHYSHSHLAIGAQPTIGRWQPQASVAVYRQWYKMMFRGHEMSLGNPLLFITLNNSLRLPYDWIVNVDFSWQSAGDGRNIHLKSNNSLDISITKRWMKGNLALNIKGYDLLKMRDQRLTMYNSDILLKTVNRTDTRSVRLRITYKFNATRSHYQGKGAGDAAKARIGRE